MDWFTHLVPPDSILFKIKSQKYIKHSDPNSACVFEYLQCERDEKWANVRSTMTEKCPAVSQRSDRHRRRGWKVGLLMGRMWSRWIGKQRFNLSHWRFQWSLLKCLHSGMSTGEVGQRLIRTKTTRYCGAKQTQRMVHGSTQATDASVLWLLEAKCSH